MGSTHVTVSVYNLAKSKPPFTASFLVDTEAIVCLAPAEELRKAGIEPEGREAYELANGAPVRIRLWFRASLFYGFGYGLENHLWSVPSRTPVGRHGIGKRRHRR